MCWQLGSLKRGMTGQLLCRRLSLTGQQQHPQRATGSCSEARPQVSLQSLSRQTSLPQIPCRQVSLRAGCKAHIVGRTCAASAWAALFLTLQLTSCLPKAACLPVHRGYFGSPAVHILNVCLTAVFPMQAPAQHGAQAAGQHFGAGSTQNGLLEAAGVQGARVCLHTVQQWREPMSSCLQDVTCSLVPGGSCIWL